MQARLPDAFSLEDMPAGRVLSSKGAHAQNRHVVLTSSLLPGSLSSLDHKPPADPVLEPKFRSRVRPGPRSAPVTGVSRELGSLSAQGGKPRSQKNKQRISKVRALST